VKAEQIRMRDFDEIFFLCGASDYDIAKFAVGENRGFTLQKFGFFLVPSRFRWPGIMPKCIRELGATLDRATTLPCASRRRRVRRPPKPRTR